MAEVRVVPESYTVTIWPETTDCEHSARWCVTVAARGHGRWAVLRSGTGSRICLAADGQWDIEPSPSSRDDTWLLTHRFSLDAALELARKHAPRVTINGQAAVQVFADHKGACSG